MWQSRIGRDISATEVLPEKQEISSPDWAPQPRTPMVGRGVPTAPSYENHQGFPMSG